MDNAFLPRVEQVGSPWKSTREMLRDVFLDLSDTSLRDFLLKTPSVFDIEVLTSPDCISRGISSTRSFGGTTSLSVVLVVPTHKVDNIAFGVSVESYAPSHYVPLTLRTTDLMFHFFLNGQTTQALSVALDHRNDLACVRYIAKGDHLGAQFQFHLQPFLNSFGKHIDFECLQRALIKSHVSFIGDALQGPSVLPTDTGPVLRGEKLPPEYRSYFGPKNFCARTISTQYRNGCPSRIQPILASFCKNDGTYRGAVEFMTSWAVRNTLTVASPVPKAPVSRSVDKTTKEVGKSKSAKLIAPAQVRYIRDRPMSYAEQINAMVDEKEERRKIQKRIAAMKSSDKKKQMQNARL